MPSSEPTLLLRPALRRPSRRREVAIAATVLCASASGGVLVALLQPRRASLPVVVPLPVPQVITAPAAAAAPAASRLPFDLAPVIDAGGLRVVVESRVEQQWIDGAIRVSDHDDVRVVERPLTEVARARFGALTGTRLRLHAPGGASCTAEVTGVVALGRFVPDDFGEPERPVDPAAAWSAAESSHVIAADLAPREGSCEGMVWAQPDSSPLPVLATISEASADQSRRAADLLAADGEYAEASGGQDDLEIEVKAIALPAGETVLVASAFAQGCAEHEPVWTAFYVLQADGSLHPVGTGVGVGAILAAADFDGDRRAEIIAQPDALDVSILRRRTDGYRVEARADVPIYGCRC